jgi:hypothetical protein
VGGDSIRADIETSFLDNGRFVCADYNKGSLAIAEKIMTHL